MRKILLLLAILMLVSALFMGCTKTADTSDKSDSGLQDPPSISDVGQQADSNWVEEGDVDIGSII